MFVINFDFSEYHSHFKFLLVNIPVLITEALTYPLQRIQTQLIIRDNFITKNQFNESRLILMEMLGIEGFPKFLHGIRYSMDYSITQMTTKFFVFDWLMQIEYNQHQKKLALQQQQYPQSFQGQYQQQPQQSFSEQMKSKLGVYLKCILANGLGTFLSQSAFNYQVLASSLPVNSKNRGQDVKQKLIEYTKNRSKIPLIGLKYTIPVSIYNTILEVFLIEKMTHLLKINQDSNKNYTLEEMGTALSAFFITGFAFHFSYLRQVQLIMKLKLNSLPYTRGLLGTMVRHVARGMTLYGLYYLWFQHESKKTVRLVLISFHLTDRDIVFQCSNYFILPYFIVGIYISNLFYSDQVMKHVRKIYLEKDVRILDFSTDFSKLTVIQNNLEVWAGTVSLDQNQKKTFRLSHLFLYIQKRYV